MKNMLILTVLRRVFAAFIALLMQLGLPIFDTLSPAQPDGTELLEPAEQSWTRAKVLSESYYAQYYNPALRRLSFHAFGSQNATCWEYIGLISLTYKLAQSDSACLKQLDGILEGLRHYRKLNADGSFAGYVVDRAALPDATESVGIAYDDNMWLGRDFVALYELTNDARYLTLAKEIADFILANAYVELPQALFSAKGLPVKEETVGGFYWDYRRDAVHTCSTGPAAQFLAALYRVTNEPRYLDHAKAAYHFLSYLENDAGVFHDLMRFTKDADNRIIAIGSPDTATYSYNSGSPITAAMELYRITQDAQYLNDAKHWAQAAEQYFGAQDYSGKGTSAWFNLILLNGYTALAPYADEAQAYIEHMRDAINFAYDNYRAEGLLGVHENALPPSWTDGFPDQNYRPNALQASAAAEIYATLHSYDIISAPNSSKNFAG